MRATSILLGVVLCLVACGGSKNAAVVVESPTTSEVTLPYVVGVIEGRLENDGILRVRVTSGGETFSFDARPGWRLAVREIASRSKAPGATPNATSMALRAILEENELDAEVEPGPHPGAFVLHVRDPEDLAAVVGLTGDGADLVCAIEVRPTEQYRTFSSEEPAPRLAKDPPWPGTAEEFRTWMTHEVGRWNAVEEDGEPYVPARDDMRVVLREGAEARRVEDFAVVSTDERDMLRMDASVVREPLVSRGPAGQPVVLYKIRPGAQDRLRAMTTRNLGLPMAMILSDRYRSAPVIQSPLTDNVQITLGSGRAFAEVLFEAKALAEGLHRGGIDTRLVAATHVGLDGDFRVLVPPTQEGTVVGLWAVGRDGVPRESATGTTTFRLRPGVELSPQAAVDSTVAAMRLGLLEGEQAAVTLRPFGDGVAEPLAARLVATEPLVRAGLVDLLGRLGFQEPVHRALADDASPIVRQAAVRVTTGEARLRTLLNDETSTDVLMAAAERIGKLGDAGVPLVPDLLRAAAKQQPASRVRMAGMVHNLFPAAREAVREAIQSDDASLRAAALSTLAFDNESATLAMVTSLLDSRHPDVRLAALGNLLSWQEYASMGLLSEGGKSFSPTGLVAAVAKRLEDTDERIRGAALLVLARLGTEGQDRIVPLLGDASVLDPLMQIRLLRGNPNWRLRDDKRIDAVIDRLEPAKDLSTRTLRAYLVRGRRGDAEPLRSLLDELARAEGEESRAAAALFLPALDKAEAVPRLVALLDDASTSVQQAAAVMLQDLDASTDRSRAILEAVAAGER